MIQQQERKGIMAHAYANSQANSENHLDSNMSTESVVNLPLWIDFFDDLQNIRGRSLNTVMAYRRDLGLYSKFALKNLRIIDFYDFMKTEGLSARSQARVVSSLRTYFKFIETKVNKSIELRDLRPPKVKATLPKILTQSEFEKLLISSDVPDAAKKIRNQTTLLFLYGSGCRVTELINLNLNDFSSNV